MYKIPQEKIDEIRSASNVVHYISQYLNLKKEGRNFKGLCPFHQEKTPSFVVSPEKQFYHCFGCGRGGNLFTFIMEYEKLAFVEAVRKAADFAGIALPKVQQQSDAEISHTQKLFEINALACSFFEKQLHKEENKRYLHYFEQRKLSKQTIANFRLSYAPDSFDLLVNYFRDKKTDLKLAEELGLIQQKQSGDGLYSKFRQRMMFPFFNIAGQIIGFGGRKINEDQQPKYLNSPESTIYKKGLTLYGLHQAIQSIREFDYIVLVEGYFDLLRLINEGMKNVVASSGTALTEQQARLMARYSKNIYIAYDGDEAGKKAAVRNAQIIENQEMNAHIIPLPAGDDPDSFVIEKGIKAFRELFKRKLLPIEFQLENYNRQNPNPSMEEKDRFISEVLNELTSFKSDIKTGLYLHHLADQMQVNESMLVNEMNRLRRRNRRFQQSPAAAIDQESDSIPEIKRGAYKAEEGLIDLLINAENDIKNYVVEHVASDLFSNTDYADLYHQIIHELEEHGLIDPHKLFDNPKINPNQHRIITKLILNEFPKDIKYARDCIYQLRKWRLEQTARDLSQQIKSEENSQEAVTHYTYELNRLRKEIAELNKDQREASKPKFN